MIALNNPFTIRLNNSLIRKLGVNLRDFCFPLRVNEVNKLRLIEKQVSTNIAVKTVPSNKYHQTKMIIYIISFYSQTCIILYLKTEVD